MSVYSINGTEIYSVYDASGGLIEQAYDIQKNELLNIDNPYDAAHSKSNVYAGGLIEVQPDSWDGTTPVVGDIVQPSDPTAWGFPMDLSSSSKASIQNEMLSGDGFGVSFIRFPMGFGYRGYRNIDSGTGLAKNIGQRFEGQNSALQSWFSSIIQAGGGLDVEYWCPAPYWLTGGAYYNANVNNVLWAGGQYSRTTALDSIRATDPTQYAAQIDAFTDAIVNDLEYVHQNVAPVRMYTLAAEPTQNGRKKFGHCQWSQTLYNDVFAVLHPKVKASATLSTYDGKENEVLMHMCADCEGFAIGNSMINDHPSWIWGYSHDVMQPVNGETGTGADLIKSVSFPTGSQTGWKNVFMCEYEYFSTTSKTNEFRFANNVCRMIFELWYRKAKVIMPIIHICKPSGQSSTDTNTTGYCIYAVNMSDGSYAVNPWAYNSWMMFNDNLPVGAVLVSGGDSGLSQAGYVVFKKDGKTIIFIGNYSDESQSVSIPLGTAKPFGAKLYSLSDVGTPYGTAEGSTLSVTVPAYSGLVLTEVI